MKKKLAITALSGVLFTSSIGVVSADTKSFKDIPKSHQFYNEIHKLSHKGVINGYSDGTFRAQQKITRAQAATLIAKALDLDVSTVKKPGFTDVVETSGHYKAIAKLTELGVFKDTKNFNPEAPLTRAQMAKILVEAFDLQAQKEKRFDDVLASEASKYAGVVGSLGITTNEGNFFPNNHVTRGQLAAFIERVIDYKRLDLDDDDLWDDWDDWDDLDDLYDELDDLYDDDKDDQFDDDDRDDDKDDKSDDDDRDDDKDDKSDDDDRDDDKDDQFDDDDRDDDKDDKSDDDDRDDDKGDKSDDDDRDEDKDDKLDDDDRDDDKDDQSDTDDNDDDDN